MKMDLDNFFNKHAEFGYYQKQYFFFLAGLQAFGAFQNIHNTFLGAEPAFHCVEGNKNTGCPEVGGCEKYYFHGDDFTSIVSEFQLVCDQNYKANLVQTIYMGALFIGSIVFGKLADTYGRKKTLIFAITGMSFFALVGMFATNYWFYVSCRAVSAFFNGGWGLISFVFLTEMVGSSKRGFAGIIVPSCFAVGIMIFAILAYYIRNWHILTFVTAVPGFIGLYFIWFFVESPRWLYSKGRLAEAEEVANYILTKNNGGRIKQDPIRLKDPSVSNQLNEKSSDRIDSSFDLLRVPTLRNRTLNNIFTWFVNCCAYYGLTMGMGNLGGNMYIGVALSGIVEIPAYIAALYMMNSRLGRKYTYAFSMLFGGAVCISIIMIPENASLLRSAFALLGKMAISLSFSVAWLYSAEMYPTSLRNQGVSLCTGSSRIGGMISPLLMQLSRIYPYSDFMCFGALALVAGLLAFKLPETHNKRLAECVAHVLQEEENSHSNKPSAIRVNDLSDDKVRLLQEEIEDAENVEV